MKEIVYLIDANAFFYRAFYAIKDLRTAEGFPTGAIFGFTAMVRKLLKDFAPVYIAACFDVSRKTFRTELFKEYKSNRPVLDDALRVQIPYVKEIVRAYGIPLLEKESFEADDVIASVSKKARAEGYRVCIVSSDKDILQLISGTDVVVYDPVKKRSIDEDAFRKTYGFAPQSMVDFIALTGDAVDNIPGIKGIGEKTAASLIASYGTAEEVLKQSHQVRKENVRRNLHAQHDDLLTNKRLILLRDDVDIIETVGDLRVREVRYDVLHGLFRKFEFKKFIDKELMDTVFKDAAVTVRQEQSDARTRRECIAFIRRKKELLFMLGEDYAHVLSDGSAVTLSLPECKELFEDDAILKVALDVKAAMHLLEKQGISLRGKIFDISVACSVVDASCVKANAAEMYYFFFKENVSPALASQLAALERLYRFLTEKTAAYQQEKLISDTEMPLVRVLFFMERSGVRLDLAYLKKLRQEVDSAIEAVQSDIYRDAAETFNLNSPQQIARIFFEKLKIPPLYKTKTGYSTNEEVLQSLSRKYPIAERMLRYRTLNKIQGTYVVPFIEQAEAHQGHIYAQFEQATTNTGRLSSHSPNLQNIPARGEWGDKIRAGFISSFPGGVLLAADYSQIELRVLAALSGDVSLKKAFAEDQDIHTFTASLVFDKKVGAVTEQEREVAKKINFGIVYGISSYGLSKQISIDPAQAEFFIQQYFIRYPGVQKYIEKTVRDVEKNGYACTLLGRRRTLPHITSDNRQLREFAQRQAVNTPVQGTAAEIIKQAMVQLYAYMQAQECRSRLIIQIHDELVVDAHPKEADMLAGGMKRIMEQAMPLDVPLKAVVQKGMNWGQMEEIAL